MELSPNDFNRAMPHKPKNLDIPAAILFKMEGCGWCQKMDPEWSDAAAQIGFMNMYTFTVDKNTENEEHWLKIKNSLETPIDGFPTIMFYPPAYKNSTVLLYDGGYMPAKDIVAKMIEFEESS